MEELKVGERITLEVVCQMCCDTFDKAKEMLDKRDRSDC